MNSEMKKLAKALDAIKRQYPAGGKRYNRIVENPYDAGYMPFPRPSKKAVAAGRRLRKRRGHLAVK
jgi:hypothetical protein